MSKHNSEHEYYMQRCFELALKGSGLTSPNPLVGALIVKDGEIISEGHHLKAGLKHAEAEALSKVKDPQRLSGATLYVNLEPCCHVGKTPPCTELIINSGIREVVYSNQDPYPLVSGKGHQQLAAAGVAVVSGVLEKEGAWLNRRFFCFQQKKRPYVVLKWAETTDGFISREDGTSKWISSESSRKLVHQWRAEEDLVLVGYRTALNDDPMLSVRHVNGRNPIRAVIDNDLSLAAESNFFDGSQKSYVFNKLCSERRGELELIKINTGEPAEILKLLAERRIISLLIEGGSALLEKFIQSGLWDEARIFISPSRFSNGLPAPSIKGRLKEEDDIEGDNLKILLP